MTVGEIRTIPGEKIAFITGANRGLGFERARELGAAGVRVLLGSRSLDAGETAAGKLHELGLQAEMIQFDIVLQKDHVAARDYIE